MATASTTTMEDAKAPTGAAEGNITALQADNGILDHPKGAEIRRQVEYYFSDENLATDKHLLQCCGGRENLPVSISRIRGFQKMRQYKPKMLVIAALRLSTFLEVSADGKTIKRKVPLQGKCVLDPDYFEDDEIAYDPRARKPAQYPLPLLPQKKATYADGLSKNMLKPTGFEKTYIEPPQTPQEASEDEAMYSPDKPSVERIELAIQRFKQKKRMHAIYAVVFNKLMRFGGVESGPRMYQGMSKAEMKEMDTEEITRALATHSVPWDRSDEGQWVVDFETVCKAFLSSWYPNHYGFSMNGVKNACQVPRTFFNYLRSHRVCPEYDHQLVAALRLCDIAEDELPKVHAACLALPGDFNKSASVIFGGAQAGLYTGDKAWAQDMKNEGTSMEEIGIRDEEAKIKFGTGIAIMGSDEHYENFSSNTFNVVGQESASFEVTSVQLPDEDTKMTYAEQSKTYQHKLERLEPLGKLICKTWYPEDCDEYDLPKDNDKYPGGKPRKSGDGKTYEFWMEESILNDCFVGMKLVGRILRLSGGLTILDDINETMCSFFTYIPNELWMENKPKEVRWLEKAIGLDDDWEGEGETKEGADTGKGASDDEFDDED
ncbi:hypothetical protein BDW02DRAFT_565309 [Decorospora gaudefroyi]|uniref:HTH La-type RNA-binding domain-containing protein n=1 Tax=Decorospora gaudefroyi TaxID=184978 RepID=A0A6A5KPU3_9PLEO|nr:hypothetical protein BDW02DRAFT_565309 [Decorospora gaudefroyi]